MQLLYQILVRIRPSIVASLLKTLLRVRRRVVSTSEGRFFVDPVSNFGNTLVSGVSYEPGMLTTLKSILREGDTFVDVGANEGYFSIVASKLVGPTGRVISIEPQSRLQAVLFRNLAENSADNVRIVQSAIADVTGTATLSLAPDMNTGSSGIFRTTKYRNPTESVPVTTLRAMVDLLGLKTVRLMKMDIEGFEYEAILGSRSLFNQSVIENIALELHPQILERRKKSISDILDFLVSAGYTKCTDQPGLVLKKSLAVISGG